MFPEFAPEKAMWVIAALATVAVFVTRAHADVVFPPQSPSAAVHLTVQQALRATSSFPR